MNLKEKIIKINNHALSLDLKLNFEFDKNGNVEFVVIFNSEREEILSVFLKSNIDSITINDKNDNDEIYIEVMRLCVNIYDEFQAEKP